MVGKKLKKNVVATHHYHDIFENAPIGIYSLDEEGYITSFNPKMSEISGDSPKETLGLNVFDFESYKKVGLDKQFREGLAGKPFEREVRYKAELSHKVTTRYYRGVPIKGKKRGTYQLILLVEDITAKKKAEKKLEKSREIERLERERLLALINSVADGVIALNGKQQIIEYNGAALSIFDLNEDVMRQTLGSLVRITDKSKRRKNIDNIIAKTNTPQIFTDWLLWYPDGEYINLYASVAPVHLGYGKQGDSGHVLLLRDITKEKSLEEERDEFISVVSHELRTPVAITEGNISNALFVSQKQNSPKQVIASLKEAHDQTIFLANMINDLATLSRAERSSSNIESIEINPASLIMSLQEDYEPSATKKGLQLVASSAANIKPIHTSELYLREILQNFITNAIKYTKKGSVFLHVRSDKNGSAVFSVADTGIGLSKSDQKHIYEKFFRSEDFRTRESSGTGLGLYVTSKLANKIGAKITLESELNKGSTFTITLPPELGMVA